MTSQTCVRLADGGLAMREIDVPEPGPRDVLLRTRLATICGSDIHFLRDFPMPRGAEYIAMGHEAVGEVLAAGDEVRTVAVGDRVVPSCLVGCGRCESCLRGRIALCATHGGKLPGMANALAGLQGEVFAVPDADVNVARVPDTLSDEQAILAGDVMSTGFGAVERAGLESGDTVAVIAQGPVGLCATAGARILGAGLVIAVEGVRARQEMARRLGANAVVAPSQTTTEEVLELTGGRGVDVAIEALGRPETFEAAVSVTRLDGTISSVGVYAGHRSVALPVDLAFYQREVVTTLCPVGADRLRRLMAIAAHHETDLSMLFTHRRPLAETDDAYPLFEDRSSGAIKIALVPDA